MSCERFDPKCPLCGPVILDVKTGKPLPDDHPTMRTLMRAWNAASFAEQEAFWRVTVKNSRDPTDLNLCHGIVTSISMETN